MTPQCFEKRRGHNISPSPTSGKSSIVSGAQPDSPWKAGREAAGNESIQRQSGVPAQEKALVLKNMCHLGTQVERDFRGRRACQVSENSARQLSNAIHSQIIVPLQAMSRGEMINGGRGCGGAFASQALGGLPGPSDRWESVFQSAFEFVKAHRRGLPRRFQQLSQSKVVHGLLKGSRAMARRNACSARRRSCDRLINVSKAGCRASVSGVHGKWSARIRFERHPGVPSRNRKLAIRIVARASRERRKGRRNAGICHSASPVRPISASGFCEIQVRHHKNFAALATRARE